MITKTDMRFKLNTEARCILLMALVVIMVFIIGCNGKHAGDALTLKEAIAKGREALKQARYPHWNEDLFIEADDNNTKWNDDINYSKDVKTYILKSDGTSVLDTAPPYAEEIEKYRLNERRYWAIYYVPRPIPGEHIRDTDAWVFIDRSNGEVIWVLRY